MLPKENASLLIHSEWHQIQSHEAIQKKKNIIMNICILITGYLKKKNMFQTF